MPQPPRKWGRPVVLATTNAKPKPDAALWDVAADSFLIRCRREDLSPKTLSLYRHILVGDGETRRLRLFLDEHGITLVSEFTAGHLSTFEAEIFDAGLSNSTVTTYHRTIRTFLGWCAREAGLDIDPAVFMVKGPKRTYERPDVFTPGEIAKLLAGAKSNRDRVILQVFLRTGLRLEEVAALHIGDVIDGPAGSYLHIRGRSTGGAAKGNKDRIVPLDTKTVKLSVILRKYIRDERSDAGPDDALFMGRTGLPMSRDAIKSMVERLGDRVGVNCHAHKFRHTFATSMLSAGVDALSLQRSLGHTSLTMVSRYIHFDPANLTRTWGRLEA